MVSQTLYKVLGADGRPFHGGRGTWNLPQNDEPGEWMPPITPVVPCESGYHLATLTQLPEWLGPTIYVAEYRGELVEHKNKVVVSEARLLRRCGQWTKRSARLFACDCAEHVIHIWEKQSDDTRPHKAIEVARRFADGEAIREELNTARDAARAAAQDAAWAAARAAAQDAAGVAWAASYARDAGGAAARDAELKWQVERLAVILESDS